MSDKPVLVLLVAPPMELARLVDLSSGYLPVKRGKVASSRMVAGLEGAAALTWIEGAENKEEAMKLLLVVRDMVTSLYWSYSEQAKAARLAAQTGVEQSQLFDF